MRRNMVLRPRARNGLRDIGARPLPFFLNLLLGQRFGLGARDDDQIDADGHEIAQFSEGLTRHSLHAIADDGVADLASHDDAEARRCSRTQRRWAHQKDEMRGRRPQRATLNAQKLDTRPEARSHGALLST